MWVRTWTWNILKLQCRLVPRWTSWHLTSYHIISQLTRFSLDFLDIPPHYQTTKTALQPQLSDLELPCTPCKMSRPVECLMHTNHVVQVTWNQTEIKSINQKYTEATSMVHGIQCFHFFLVFSSSLVLRDDGKTVGGETEIILFFLTHHGKKKQWGKKQWEERRQGICLKRAVFLRWHKTVGGKTETTLLTHHSRKKQWWVRKNNGKRNGRFFF